MIDLGEVFLTAWDNLKPHLDAHPDELQARLARRHTARLQRPLREWAIALRANDRRLTPVRAAMIPDDAPAHLQPHTVEIDVPLFHHLHRPVETDFPHNLIPEMAQRLGVTDDAVRTLVGRGDLRQRRIKGFAHKNDRWGGIPFVTGDRPFNPNFGHRMRTPEPLWGAWWQDLPHALPKTFHQTLHRIPQFLTDQHANPRSTKNHPHRNHPRPAKSSTPQALTPSSPHLFRPDPIFTPTPRFWGWRWLCPACQNTCRLIFCPTPIPLPPCFELYLKKHLPADELTPPAPTFACAKCHHLRGQISWASPDAWNHAVTQISGGLLFGDEVTRPTWLKCQRKLPHKRKSPTNYPAPKRTEVEHRLIKGWTYPMIAKDLGISPATVTYHVRAAKRAHNCPTRQALMTKLRAATTAAQRQPRSA
jgi:hypothetical protein